MIDIDFDTTEIQRQMERVRHIPYAVQKVLYPAVAEVMHNSREFLARHLASDVPLSEKIIGRSVKVAFVRSLPDGAVGRVSVASKALPLINYDVKPAEVTARKGVANTNWPGFTYALRTGERRNRERLEDSGLPFIAAMHNRGQGGHLGVFRRTTAGQLKELYGPRLQYHATTPEVQGDLMARADADMLRILPAHVSRVLEEQGAGAG